MATQRGIGLVVLMVGAGLAIGSLFGELLGSFLASGWVHDLFTRGPTIGLTSPATLDLRFLSLTFGLAMKINLVGVLGIVVAALALRRM
jgi:hypothetical protein